MYNCDTKHYLAAVLVLLVLAATRALSLSALGKFQLPSCCDATGIARVISPKPFKGVGGERSEGKSFEKLMRYLHCMLLFAAYLF